MQTVFKRWHVPLMVPPLIHHFSGGAKPWLGRFLPLARFTPLYERLRARIPERLAPCQTASAARRRAITRRHLRWTLQGDLLWPRMALRLARIAAYEARVREDSAGAPRRA